MDALDHALEALTNEIDRIVVDRQRLRAAGAGASELEQNRRELAAAQARLSHLIIRRHFGTSAAA